MSRKRGNYGDKMGKNQRLLYKHSRTYTNI
nr:MAG TPA: hypothetical protein [Caudoviricetes sp.]